MRSELKKKKAVYDKDAAEKRGVDALYEICCYSLEGRALERAQRMRDKCLHDLYMLLEIHGKPIFAPLPEPLPGEPVRGWISRKKD